MRSNEVVDVVSGVSPEFIADLKRHEGWRDHIYEDTLGVATFGYGFTLLASDKKRLARFGLPVGLAGRRSLSREALAELRAIEIDRREADAVLRETVADYKDRFTEAWPWTLDFSRVRFEVLLGMAYNMGVMWPAKFPKAVAAMRSHDNSLAVREMADSDWAAVVGQRAVDYGLQFYYDVRHSVDPTGLAPVLWKIIEERRARRSGSDAGS